MYQNTIEVYNINQDHLFDSIHNISFENNEYSSVLNINTKDHEKEEN